MALNFTEAQSYSDKGYDKICVQTVYDNTPFWKKLELNKKIQSKGGGRTWDWPVRYKKLGKANAVGPRDRIDFIEEETVTTAEVTPKYVVGSTVIPWDKIAENEGDAEIIDIIKEKSIELKEDFMDRLSTDLFTANPNGKGIEPLTAIVDSSTSTASAGITPTDVTTGSWVAKEDGTTTKLELYGGLYGTTTLQSLASMVSACEFGRFGPTMFLTTKELKSVFESKMDSRKDFNSKLGDQQMADAGFKNVAFHGVGVFSDPYVPAGSWFGLDMDNLFLLQDPRYYLKITPWKEISEHYMYSLQKKMAARMQLKWTQRRTHFKFTALDASQI